MCMCVRPDGNFGYHSRFVSYFYLFETGPLTDLNHSKNTRLDGHCLCHPSLGLQVGITTYTFSKGEFRVMPWPLGLQSSTLLNSRNTILTLWGILLENYFSGSHSGFLLPLLQVWCHFNVIDKYISFPLLLNSHCLATAFATVFVFTVPTSFFFVGKLCCQTMTNSTSWASQSCAYTSNHIWQYVFFFPCGLL